jgi:hypothetical protein
MNRTADDLTEIAKTMVEEEQVQKVALTEKNDHNGVKQVADPYVVHRSISKIHSGMLNQPFMDDHDDSDVNCLDTKLSARSLYAFCVESHAIEGIVDSALTEDLALRTADFLDSDLSIETLGQFNTKGFLRTQLGMDLKIGTYRPPQGGPNIRIALRHILGDMYDKVTPYEVHCRFMTLQPYMDGNGITGRVLWLYQRVHMNKTRPNKFLRNWYMDSLAHWRENQ